MQVAIDGPAGAGKSTIAKAAAKMLNFIYIDTGAMYRAVGLYVVRKGLDTKIREDVISVLEEIEITISYDESGQQVFLNGENVSEEIRLPEISVAASDVAVIPEVRAKLLQMQRKLASENDVIMDGRDICAYVLPEAEVKVFLTASIEARADRRYKQLLEKGTECDLEQIKMEMQWRDKNDSQREVAPLKKADDAVLLDTSNLTLDESINALVDLIKGDN